ncbi:MAG: NAD(P)H-dependent oxidoreductase [Patescibacteria group bacterium]|nr:NAD(P)H-dependent oxidoreductase [Patescibacteria group bacterium]
MVTIHVIIGSTREKRFSEKPARWIFEELRKLPGVTAELVDLRDYPLPFFNDPMSPGMAKGAHPDPQAAVWAKKVAEADGYVVVAPEYNYGYPAVLKNAFDYVFYEWANKSIGFVSYGTVGGARAIDQLRQVAIGLQMMPIRLSVNIPSFWTLVDKEGNFDGSSLQETAKKFLEQLVWSAEALKAAREKDKTQSS